MLDILENAINDNYDYDYNVGIMYNYDGILKELEKAGMLPPPNYNLLGEFVDILEWEPEDV